ncbi:hypothetical protein EYC84_010295 [Monilinia fructicola]|uniref:Enoyl reductase (ER) domain-containing protein n=1 Tax=Monilinia fructicola TaxID=38448 RepID=A0A5M9JF34_MONFR|nr:hypothetical protein EYC84_010295 [Monilinia fructicola]
MSSALQNQGIVKTAVGKANWQTVSENPSPRAKGNTLLGCDFAGIVVEVGKDVRKGWKRGDGIAGVAHGGNDIEPEDGTFASYIMVKGDVAFHIPPSISFEQASSLGCGVTTVASATGTLAIQFARLSGLEVITTSSPRNFQLLKDLGADHVLDYKSSSLTPGSIAPLAELIFVLSLETNFTTCLTRLLLHLAPRFCADALSTSADNLYVNLMGVEMPRDDVKNVFFLGYSVTGEEYEIEGDIWPAASEDFELGKKIFTLLEGLLENGLIRNHPLRIMNGGLAGILEGLREMKEGKVSGEKLVYRIGEQ